MMAEELDAKKFRETAVEHPQNAVLFGDGVLAKVLASGATLEEIRDVARGELLARMLLNADRYGKPVKYETKGVPKEFDARRELCDCLGEEFLLGFLSRAEACGLSAGEKQKKFRVRSLFDWARKNCRIDAGRFGIFEEMVRPWVEADGVVPVYRGDEGFLLPFSFMEESGRLAVLDCGGEAIEPWTGYFRELVRDYGIRRSVRVSVWQGGIFKAEGRSLMLPLLAAWKRRFADEESRLPHYHPLRFIMTGDIVGGRVKGVEWEAKERKIRNCVKDGTLAYPGMKRGPVRMREGESVEEALESLRRLAERTWASSVKCAAKRLKDLDGFVRREGGGDWDETIARLDKLGEGMNRDVDAEDWLNWQMLRSTARCHAGRTEEAHAINREAAEFAGMRNKFAAQLLRLRIEEMVLLQDEENFGDVFHLAGGVEDGIGKLANGGADGKTCADLLMRYHGTMGQAKAYAAIGGKGGEADANESRRHFETAYGYALELAQADNAYVADCCQDANYLVLWESLFGGEGVKESAAKARGMCNRLRACDGGDEAAAKNDKFRHRFEALARYRAVLEGRDAPGFKEEDFSGEMSGEGGWVEATIRKYEGAVAAKSGDLGRAKELFAAAAELVVDKDSGILGAIRMTVHAEAYRSLRGHDGDAAERHRAEALRLIEAGVAGSVDGDGGWRRWLEQGGTDETFPGLHWWY